jgi:4-amino-4-deoxy-L-arabinose transferase-like glycosyltransferase
MATAISNPAQAPRRRERSSRRAVLAALILLLAFGLRLGYVETQSYHAINDAGTYNRLASMIARFGDYHTGDRPKSGAGGSRGPTAYFPPAFPYVLAAADLVDGHTAGGHAAVAGERLEMAVAGTIAVGLVGLVALEAFGPLAGLVALGLAAVYPVMIELSGTLVAEDMVVVWELAAVWALLRSRRATGLRPTLAWMGLSGLLTGLTALTHENGILYLLPFLAGAGLILARHPATSTTSRRRRRLQTLAGPAVMALACAAIIAPWTIRNALELHHFVPIADETGITLAGTYNPVSAADAQVPYKWHLFSHVPSLRYLARRSRHLTELQLSDQLEARALQYISAHPAAPLAAGLHNTLRMFELEGSYAWHASASAQGLRANVAAIGIVGFWLTCLLAIGGLFTGMAHRSPWWMWAMPVLWWLTIAAVNVETPRFREPIDPFIVLLAACLITTALQRRTSSSGLRRAPIGRRRRPAELPGDQAELVEMVEGQP